SRRCRLRSPTTSPPASAGPHGGSPSSGAASAPAGRSTWSGTMTAAASHPSSASGRRYLFLALPRLSTDRHFRQTRGRSWRCAALPDGEAPFALIGKVKSAMRLLALDEEAERLGLQRGMTLADA